MKVLQKVFYQVLKGEGIITCIPKDNKLRNLIKKNYRPISSLNCVYKIASGVIALKMKSTLLNLIYAEQTGFISG